MQRKRITALPLFIVEEGFEHFQQVIDIPWLSALVIHPSKELLDVVCLYLLNLNEFKLALKIPLKIAELL